MRCTKQAVSSAEHKPETDQKECYRADGEVHQVLHKDVDGIFRSGKTALDHCETWLHEEHQKRRNACPHNIYIQL